MRGKFITLEGIDGAGKSTHLEWLAQTLSGRERSVRVTREPGGTPLGERLRELLLQPGDQLDGLTEAMRMFAARQEHLTRVIRPALAAGQWVLCDRFTDATIAYQGWGRGVDLVKLEALEALIHGDLQPDLTLLFDTPLEVASTRRAQGRPLDRIEQENLGAVIFVRMTGEVEDRLAVQTYPLVQVALIDFLVEVREAQAAEALKKLVESGELTPEVKKRAEQGLKQIGI